METRIRYKRKENNTLLSNKTFQVQGHTVCIWIDLNANSYKVSDTTTGQVMAQGTDKNPAYVKKAAKTALQSLGYVFTDEKRNRDVGADVTTAA